MRAFFTPDQTQSDKISKTPQSCASCGLFKKATNGRMKPWGKFGKKILIVGDAPSRRDDRKKKAWSDSDGDYLKWAFKKNGIHLFRDTITTYACQCPIPKDARPEENEVFCCRRRLMKQIKKLKPKMIFLVGSAAVKAVIGKSWKKGLGGMERWRGWNIPDREHGAWIHPIFTPKYTESREDRQGRNLAEIIWLKDIKEGLKKLDSKIIWTDEREYITHVKSDKHFREVVKRLLLADMMCFDYEGTGLKPHKKGHKITHTSAAISTKECYSWANNPYRDKFFKKVLESKVKKIAHNISFENVWSLVILKAIVRNWFWDTMVNAHLLDGRKAISGLKFQTYVNFGVADYDSLISPYLQSDDEYGANSFNTIERFIRQYGNHPVREYCGLDSLYGFGLALLQIEQMRELDGLL